MKKSELIERLSSESEDEVFIEIDGILYDIDFGHKEEAFDGFFTAYPACLTLKPIDISE
ncbi:MAG: hypothetical protein K2G77_08675 [Muribaculaceae bacterium]|nr:hypothetical protein [Muribaculaceae bacterium]